LKITVQLQATLADYSPTGQPRFDYEIEDGASVTKLIDALGIPDEQAGNIIVGGEIVSPWVKLSEGDQVTLIPPMAGG
jgi:molybdopterin converting factor small subunit